MLFISLQWRTHIHQVSCIPSSILILHQTLADEVDKVTWPSRWRECRRLIIQNVIHHITWWCVVLIWVSSFCQFNQCNAQRPYITLQSSTLLSIHLWWIVPIGSLLTRSSWPRMVQLVWQTKISQLNQAIVGYQTIRWFDILCIHFTLHYSLCETHACYGDTPIQERDNSPLLSIQLLSIHFLSVHFHRKCMKRVIHTGNSPSQSSDELYELSLPITRHRQWDNHSIEQWN